MMRIHLAAVAALLLALAGPANADDETEVGSGAGNFWAEATVIQQGHQTANTSSTGGTSDGGSCEAWVDGVCPHWVCLPDDQSPLGGRMWMVAGGSFMQEIGWCDPTDYSEAPPLVTPSLVLRAFERVPLPTPTLGTNPPGGATLVNLPTIFFTEAEPFVETVRILGRQVRLEIAPVEYRWEYADGQSFTTDWAGKSYEDGVSPEEHAGEYVTWTYENAHVTQHTRVTVVWGATYSVDGGPGQPVPGTVAMTSPAELIEVREARGVLSGHR